MTDEVLPDADVIRAAFKEGGYADADIHVFSTLGSTSAWLRGQRESFSDQLRQGRPQVCVTDWQQSGEGRRGKSFQTAPGNLTFSVIARMQAPAQQLLGLSLVTGIGVAQVLQRDLSISAMLKWPNDVMLDDRKLGGLLTELVTIAPDDSGTVYTDVISGIGINLNHDDSVAGLGIGATSLKAAGTQVLRPTRDALIGHIAATVLAAHELLVRDSWSAFAATWRSLDWLDGKAVTVHKPDSSEHAVACGVNEQGALLVDVAGTRVPLYGGNVSIRPIA